MPEPVRSRRRQLLALMLALVAAGAMLDYHLGYFIPRTLAVRAASGGGNGYSFGDDFFPVWLTIHEWQAHRLDLYGPQMTHEIQIGLFGRAMNPANPHDPPAEYRQFAYPAFTDLIFWPTALLDFPALRIVLAVLLPLLTILSIRFWLLALDWQIAPLWFALLSVLTLCTYELLEAFFAEQPGLFVGFFLASAALAIRRNRLILAGVLMSLTLIKPQVTALALLYLLFWSFVDRRRVRFWIAFCLVTLCLGAGSVLLWPRWIPEWISVLRGYGRYADPPLISVLLGRNAPRYLGVILEGGLCSIGLVIAWKNRRVQSHNDRFWYILTLLLAISVVAILPGQALYDHAVLIPAILLVAKNRLKLFTSSRLGTILFGIGALVCSWPWIAALALMAVRPFLTSTTFYSDSVFMLPIRNTVPLPFAVTALLCWSFKSRAPLSGQPAFAIEPATSAQQALPTGTGIEQSCTTPKG